MLFYLFIINYNLYAQARYPPVHYIINVLDDDNNITTYNNNVNVDCNHEVDPCYVTIIPVNIIGYGPLTTVNGRSTCITL